MLGWEIPVAITAAFAAGCLATKWIFRSPKQEPERPQPGVYYNPEVRDRVEEEYRKIMEDRKLLSKACVTEICPSCGGYFKLMDRGAEVEWSDYKCTTCGLEHTEYI